MLTDMKYKPHRKVFGLLVSAVFISLSALSVLSTHQRVSAHGAEVHQVEHCGGDNLSSTAYVQLPTGRQTVYARAGTGISQAPATLYIQYMDEGDEISKPCTLLGVANISDNTWSPIGSLNEVDNERVATLILVSDSGTSEHVQIDDNKPSIIMMGDSQPCDIASDCVVDYQDNEMTLQPRLLSSAYDSLKVGQYIGLNDDPVERVIYSIDGKQAYETEVLRRFDTNYVGGGLHTLRRTVILKSGQTLTDEQEIERSFTVGYAFTTLITKYRKAVTVMGSIVGGLLLWAIAIAVLGWYRRRSTWLENHGFKKPHLDSSKPKPVEVNAEMEDVASGGSVFATMLRHWRLVASLSLLVVLIGLSDSYGITAFKVDGVSMQPTLRDGSIKPLLRLPVTVNKILGNNYLPQRGSIVVVQEKHDNALYEQIEAEKSFVVKRVIALPNERVVIKEGKITVFNKENVEGFEPDTRYGWVKDLTGSEMFRADLTMGDDEIFVVGDNRDESIDSRFYGPVHGSQVVGTVIK